MQALQQAQHLAVVRVALLHGQQGFQGAVAFATVHLQLCMGQGDSQFRLRLALQSTFQQVVAVFGSALLVGGTRGTEVVQQRLALGLGGTVQMALGTGPTALGEVQLALLDGQTNAPAAITPRPRVDHAAGSQHQADQVAHQPQQQHYSQQAGQGRPQPRLVAEAAIGDQHVAAVLGDRNTQRRGDHDRQHGQQVDTLHGLPPSASAGRWRRCI